MPGTRCSANGRPGFAGDRELWMQVAGAGAAWLRVPEARAVWRSAHSRALLAADARGRSGVSARPPSGARSRAQDCEVSEAPRRRVSGLAGRLGSSTVGLSGCRAVGPGRTVVPALQRGLGPLPTAWRIWLRRRGRGFRWGLIRELCAAPTARACSRETGTRWEARTALHKAKCYCVGEKTKEKKPPKPKPVNNVRDNW